MATRQTASARFSSSRLPFTAFATWIPPVGLFGMSDRDTGGMASLPGPVMFSARSACDFYQLVRPFLLDSSVTVCLWRQK